MELCNSQEFDKAVTVLEEILKGDKDNSEAWRVLAQIHWNHQNLPDKAYDELIEALRCDPKNIWALILMGNLLSKEHNDKEHAKEYYDKVLEYYPDNALAINNLAGTYMQQSEFDKAIPCFKRALALDSKSVNSYYGLGLCYYRTGELKEAFKTCHQGMLKTSDRPENPNVKEQLSKLFLTVASELAKTINVYNIWAGIKDELEDVDHIPIRFEEDRNLKIYAKLEYAITHGKKEHVIKYNPDRQFVDHLFIHEMMHLKMGQKATKAGRGKVVTSTEQTKAAFYRRYFKFMKNSHKYLSSQEMSKIMTQLADGLNLQLMNCPLDLLVEHNIYATYKQVRPFQLLSLYHTELDNIKNVQSADKGNVFPREIIKANKIMILVSTLHFKDMYGLDLIKNYHPTKAELDQAMDLYDEYKAYVDTFKDGDEYELLEYFVSSLNMEELIALQDEKEYAAALGREEKKEPLSDQEVDVENARFALDHQDGANATETMMMSMYMLGAMEEFDKMTKEEVHNVAIEIATVGINGISPKGKYSINSFPGKEFSGYQFLAYYYVSFARAIPNMLKSLGLPFEKAYESALQLYNNKYGKS